VLTFRFVMVIVNTIQPQKASLSRNKR